MDLNFILFSHINMIMSMVIVLFINIILLHCSLYRGDREVPPIDLA